MEEEKYIISDGLIDLAKKIHELHKIMYEMIKPEVTYIINKKVKNVNIIENTLDRLLDIPTDECYELFIKLCDYYATIDKEGAKFYLEAYEELYGEEEPKIKKRARSDDNL